MSFTLEQVIKEAMVLSPRQKLELAGLLLESADGNTDPEVNTAWESEIQDRIQAIDSGHVVGVSYDEVMRSAEERLAQ